MLLQKIPSLLRFVSWYKVVLEDELVILIRKESLQRFDQIGVQDVHIDSCINYCSRRGEEQLLNASQLSSSRMCNVSPLTGAKLEDLGRQI